MTWLHYGLWLSCSSESRVIRYFFGWVCVFIEQLEAILLFCNNLAGLLLTLPSLSIQEKLSHILWTSYNFFSLGWRFYYEKSDYLHEETFSASEIRFSAIEVRLVSSTGGVTHPVLRSPFLHVQNNRSGQADEPVGFSVISQMNIHCRLHNETIFNLFCACITNQSSDSSDLEYCNTLKQNTVSCQGKICILFFMFFAEDLHVAGWKMVLQDDSTNSNSVKMVKIY